jgi:hypothetical protein
MVQGYSYCGFVFKWPTYACGIMGLGLAVAGFLRSRAKT